ncbi:MAG: mechanosensitive ion channel protein MscS [Maritimibacter sp.]|nr:mechanosensitive ion channel protein MscS [Maritimibacter sp.]
MATFLDRFGGLLPYVLDGFKALVILIVGWILAAAVSRMVRRRVEASKRIDKTIGSFLSSIVRWVLLAVVAITVLNIFGIEATSLVAMLGAATLAIGLALQGTLSDIAAGFMIILFRPYRNGQYISIDGTSGTVTEINLFFTEMATPDNVQIIVPNGKAWGAIITNWSHHETRRVDIVMGIDYADDIDKALKVMLDMANADQRVHDDPEPWARVTNLGGSSVDLTMRMWADSADYWDLKWEFTKGLKEAFDAAGLSIPFPHRTLYVKSDEGDAVTIARQSDS